MRSTSEIGCLAAVASDAGIAVVRVTRARATRAASKMSERVVHMRSDTGTVHCEGGAEPER